MNIALVSGLIILIPVSYTHLGYTALQILCNTHRQTLSDSSGYFQYTPDII